MNEKNEGGGRTDLLHRLSGVNTSGSRTPNNRIDESATAALIATRYDCSRRPYTTR